MIYIPFLEHSPINGLRGVRQARDFCRTQVCLDLTWRYQGKPEVLK